MENHAKCIYNFWFISNDWSRVQLAHVLCTTIGSIWFGLWKWKASHNQMHLSIPSSYPNKQLTHKQHYNCCTLTTMSHTNTILLRTSWTFKWDCFFFCCMEKRIETHENTHLRRWTTHLRRKIDCSFGAVCERRLALRQSTVLMIYIVYDTNYICVDGFVRCLLSTVHNALLVQIAVDGI